MNDFSNIKRKVLLKCFNYTQNDWDQTIRRFVESKIIRRGLIISFEGTEDQFNSLLDELYNNESNSKVIGIYED